MANEITKITDQNGVDHPLVDVLGREASVDLMKDTTGWIGKNKAVFHGKGIYDLNTGVYTPLDPTNYGAWKKISCKGGEKFVFVCNNAINQVIWYEWNGDTFISATPHSDLTSSYDEYTVGSNTTLVACVARLTGGNITDDSDFGNPMIADAMAYAISPSFEPYHESVELSKYNRSEANVLGAKNLLPNKGTSTTADGITWTVNADGTVQANGTKDNNNNGFKTLDRGGDNYRLPSGRYVLSGNASSACTLMLQATRNGQLVQLGQVMGSDTEAVVDILSTDVLQCVLFVNPEQTVNNVIFYPMLRLATDTDPTYEPYAMTNRELTEKVQGIIDAALNANDFAAFKTAIGNL